LAYDSAARPAVPEKNVSDRLTKSIFRVIASYLLLQAGVFLAFALPAGFLGRYGLLFLALSGGFHGFLLALLLLFRQDFLIEATGARLDRVNLANRITLLRVSTLPTLLVLVLAAKDYRIRGPLLGLVVLVFLTDFADGYVSRKGGEVTRIGRMMDSTSDYCLLIVLTVVFYYFHFIPAWFFYLVVARLGLQALLVAILILVHRKIEPKTTLMGKAAVASIMVLYAAEVLRIVASPSVSPVVDAVEWAVGAVVALSVGDKILAFVRSLTAKKA
jgi:phosphatidylglycerophosphate synthase